MNNQIITEFDVAVPMRDGIRLSAIIIRPAKEGRFPVLITRMPYGKDAAASSGANDLLVDVYRTVREGYVVILQDTRGRFQSEGKWEMVPTMEREDQDGEDTIAWAVSLPYSTGEVGTFGGSYFAYTQMCLMDRHIAEYKAAVPTTVFATPRDGFWYRGGALELGLFTTWAMGLQYDTMGKMGMDEERYMNAIWRLSQDLEQLKGKLKSLPLKTYAPFVENQLPSSALDVICGGYENKKLVEKMTFSERYKNMSVPSLHIGGWYDVFLNGTLSNYMGIKKSARSEAAEKSRLIIGPWSHWSRNERLGDMFFGLNASAAAVDLPGMHLRWFDWIIRKQENGMGQEAPVKLFIMGDNVWRDEQEWPLARTQYTPFYFNSQGHANTLHGDGRLLEKVQADGEADHYVYDPANPVETLGGANLVLPHYEEGPKDQRAIEGREDVLVYTSEILKEDIEVTGPVKAKIWASSSAPDTDFVVRLVDVYPDGFAQNLTDGILRARYRNFEKTGEVSLLNPGEIYLFEVDLWATSNVFKRGHRIRVDVTSSNFPRWDRNPNTGHSLVEDTEKEFQIAEQRVFHNKEYASHIILPIIPKM